MNIVGGCCGTTPEHIRAFARGAERASLLERLPELARELSAAPVRTGAVQHRYPESLFVNAGERTNVTGSAIFRRLIKADDYATAALDVARQQVENGAQIIDVNMDEGMLDGGGDAQPSLT